MKILALEFSSAQHSVAVVEAQGQSKPRAVSEVVETGARATRALGLIEDALREAHIEREQVECLAVGLGPGSYTGIRAALAVAQGWELGSAGKTRLLGISCADCLAAQAQAAGMLGRVVVVIDAQRKEFYLADYEVSAQGWQEVAPLRLAPLAEVQRREQAGEQLVGPEAAAWFPKGRVLFPLAATAGRLAAARTEFVSGAELKPIYLRETTFVKTAPVPRKWIVES
jgi:tRNA threonylcarbamoyl adenosine modification protein YeaZ